MTEGTSTAAAATVSSGEIDLLRAGMAGRVLVPRDAEYEAARIVFRREVDKHPAAIARVANAADVARVIAFGPRRPPPRPNIG